jgi:hypothetical protein
MPTIFQNPVDQLRAVWAAGTGDTGTAPLSDTISALQRFAGGDPTALVAGTGPNGSPSVSRSIFDVLGLRPPQATAAMPVAAPSASEKPLNSGTYDVLDKLPSTVADPMESVIERIKRRPLISATAAATGLLLLRGLMK